MLRKVMICRFCRAEMLLEDADYCCDYCGATYNKFTDEWTLPTVEVICDRCKCKVPIHESSIKPTFDSIEFSSEILCSECLTSV
jgi:hypothetical protein